MNRPFYSRCRWWRGQVWLWLGALTVVFGGCLASVAKAQDCPPPSQSPEVILKLLPEKVSFVRTIDKHDVGGYFLGSDGHLQENLSATSGVTTVGLTNTHFSITSAYTTEAYPLEDGQWCMRFTRMTLTVGYSDQEIYIPKNYQAGSCEYQAIYDHEMEHVRTNGAVLRENLASLKAMAEHHAMSRSPMLSPTKDQLQATAKGHMDDLINGLLVDFEAERKARNAELDTPENYQEISARCSHW